MPEVIDPTNLDSNSEELFNAFLKAKKVRVVRTYEGTGKQDVDDCQFPKEIYAQVTYDVINKNENSITQKITNLYEFVDEKSGLTKQIVFTHNIQPREKENKERRYDVAIQQIGEGGQGLVKKVGTLIPPRQDEAKFSYKPKTIFSETERITKRMVYSYLSTQDLKRLLEVYKRAKHLKIKPPTITRDINGRFIVTITYPFTAGNSLEKFIYDDYYRPTLTPATCFNLMRKMAFSLKEEIVDQHLVHRDIKPGNFVLEVDNKDRIKSVKTIDVDSAKLEEINDANEREGTRGYIAPEVTNELGTDARSDIYSLGQIFHSLVYHDLAEYLAEPENKDIKSKLEMLVEAMTAEDPDKRPANINVVIAELNSIFKNRIIANDISENVVIHKIEKEQADLREFAQKIGMEARVTLNKISDDIEKSVKSKTFFKTIDSQLEMIKKTIEKDIDKIAAPKAQAMDEFTELLNVNALKDYKKPADIIKKTTAIIDEFKSNKDLLLKINEGREIKYLIAKLQKCSTLDEFNRFNEFTKQFLLAHAEKMESLINNKDKPLESRKAAAEIMMNIRIGNINGNKEKFSDLTNLYQELKSDKYSFLTEEQSRFRRIGNEKGITTTWSNIMQKLQVEVIKMTKAMDVITSDQKAWFNKILEEPIQRPLKKAISNLFSSKTPSYKEEFDNIVKSKLQERAPTFNLDKNED